MITQFPGVVQQVLQPVLRIEILLCVFVSGDFRVEIGGDPKALLQSMVTGLLAQIKPKEPTRKPATSRAPIRMTRAGKASQIDPSATSELTNM